MSTIETDPPKAERHLAAILATDVVGYSRQMERDEVGTLRRLRDLRQNLIEPKVAEHRGRIFKTMGDGFLAEFRSALDAVHCAVDIQRLMAARNLDLPEDGRLQLRIGINLGDVFHEGEDVFGDGVNIAARLESLAPPGGIYVSRAACDPIRERFAFDFEDLGEHRVKNITRPIQVFGIRIDGAAANGSAKKRKSHYPRIPLWFFPKKRRSLSIIFGILFLVLFSIFSIYAHNQVLTWMLRGPDGIFNPYRKPPAQAAAVAPNATPSPTVAPQAYAPAPPTSAAPSPTPEIAFWKSIESSKTAAEFEEYLRRYPNGQFTGLARNRLVSLNPPKNQTVKSRPRDINFLVGTWCQAAKLEGEEYTKLIFTAFTPTQIIEKYSIKLTWTEIDGPYQKLLKYVSNNAIELIHDDGRLNMYIGKSTALYEIINDEQIKQVNFYDIKGRNLLFKRCD
jgi:class 3 adenylate cyclase